MRRLLGLLAILAIGLAMIPLPCFADTPYPDTDPPPTPAFNVWHNILETNDLLLVVYANIPYTPPPATSAYFTYIWRFISVDGVTEFGSTQCYPYYNRGYGYNVISMYFSASEVATSNITWGMSHIVRLTGNPAYFTTPKEYNYPLTSSDYTVLTTSTDVKAEIASRILTIADDIRGKWGVSFSMTEEYETGPALSLYGQAFFRGAIYGIQGMVPQIFPYVYRDMTLTDRTWATTYADALEHQWDGTWVQTAKAAGALIFGTSFDLTSVIFVLLMCFGAMIAVVLIRRNATKGGESIGSDDIWEGMLDAFLVLIVLTRLGFWPLTALGLMAGLAFIYGWARITGVFRS